MSGVIAKPNSVQREICFDDHLWHRIMLNILSTSVKVQRHH